MTLFKKSHGRHNDLPSYQAGDLEAKYQG